MVEWHRLSEHRRFMPSEASLVISPPDGLGGGDVSSKGLVWQSCLHLETLCGPAPCYELSATRVGEIGLPVATQYYQL
jgi:hypothetical protein